MIFSYEQQSDFHRHSSIWTIGCVVLSLFSTVGFAADSSYQSLNQIYQQLQAKLDTNDFNAPIVVQSHVDNENVSGMVYSVIPHPFKQAAQLFSNATTLCNALDFHINVKSCTVSTASSSPVVSLYVGDKDYQQPDEAYRFDYEYRLTANTDRYLNTQLSATSGPLDSKNYLISIEAIPINENSSFIVFKYSAVYGFMTRLLINTYLATAGRHKVGFTKVGLDGEGNTKYIKGIEGLVERNAMRYMLAIYSYLDSLSYPKRQRMDFGLNRWFEFTRQYPRQLYEIGKDEYLSNKQRELKNQQTLQLAITSASATQQQADDSKTHL